MDVAAIRFVGARIMFGLGVMREWWHSEQEWQGLLRLLLAEIDHNSEVVRTIADRRDKRPVDWIGHPDLPSMKVEVWRDLQGRAPALLPSELTKALLGYCAQLETSLTLLHSENAVNDMGESSRYSEIGVASPHDVLFGEGLLVLL